MHLDLRHSPRFNVEHTPAVHVLANQREYADPIQKVVCLVGNYGDGVHNQKGDVDDDSDSNVRGKIFSLFLNLANSRFILIIKLKAQEEETSTYDQTS